MAKLRESLGTLERMSAENKVQQDRSNILHIVLVALAVFASVAMLFTSSPNVMKVAVLAALWAAFFGLILVARYRRQFEKQKLLLDEQYDRHEAELELEKAAHREQELRLEQTLRKTLLKEDDNRLDDIREQLTAVRAQLEALNGHAFEYEPAALRASATRMDDMAELSGPAQASDVETEYSSNYAADSEDLDEDDTVTEVEYTEAEYTSTQYATNAFSSSYAASNYSYSNTDYQDSSDFADADYDGDYATGPAEDYLEDPVPAPEPAKRFDTTAFAAVQWKPTTQETKVEPTPAPMNDARRGRRRRDENSEAPSVADLLKNFNKDD